MKSRGSKATILSVCAALVIQGCATAPAGSASTNSPFNVGTLLGGVLGGAAGSQLGKALADADAKRRHLNPQQTRKLEHDYEIAAALAGTAGGAALGNSVYGKLQEQGRKAREAALLAAAQQAKPQHYGEPTDPHLTGTVTPGPVYAEAGANRECRDIEDALADGSSKESIFVKMCRMPPDGGWQPVTG